MEREYLHGRAFVKKSKGKIQIFETPYGLGDFAPVLAEGTTKPRMLKDRFADVVNVKDFGAVGDGVTDDTAAIQAALEQKVPVYFPDGKYRCSDTDANFNLAFGPGCVESSVTGQIFCAGGAFAANSPVVCERRLGTPFFGVNQGEQNTEIYPYSSRGIQGATSVRLNGQEYLFIAQTASSSTDADKGNSCRITQFLINEDGTIVSSPIAFSGILPIGHGQGMGATIEDGEIYLWSMSSYKDEESRQYLGVSKTHWRGSFTISSDVTEIPLLPDEGLLSPLSSITPTVSVDGKYLIAHVGGPTLRQCLIWELNNLSEYSKPTAQFAIEAIPFSSTVQGICADSKFIYFVVSSGNIFSPQAILVHDYSGNRIAEHYISTELGAIGGCDHVINDESGLTYIIELEAIYCRGDELCVTGHFIKQPFGDVVSYDGQNYACIRDATGSELFNPQKFQPTSHAHTKEFAKDTSYTSGLNQAISAGTTRYIENYKFVYGIGSTGNIASSDSPLLSARPFSQSYDGNALISSAPNKNIRLGFYDPLSRLMSPGVIISRSALTFYDNRIGGNPKNSCGKIAFLGKDSNSGICFYGGDGNGGALSVYGSDDPGLFGLNYVQGNVGKFGVTKDGTLRIRVSKTSSTDLSQSGLEFYRGSTSSDPWVGRMYATGATLHMEGVSNLMLSAVETNGDRIAGVIIGTADPCIRAYTDGNIKCGTASYRWSEIFSKTGTINTSDEREKTSVVDPQESLMRAWGKVNFKVFQFKDAVEKKGTDARLHVGVIAQQVIEAFASEGLDATRYGLLCYDKWGDEYEDVEVVDVPEVVDEEGNITPPKTHIEHRLVTPAGDRYGIRYEEALALEAAYQRWGLDKIEASLAEKGVTL